MSGSSATLGARIFQKWLALFRRRNDRHQHYVYVTNQGSNSISQYKADHHGSLAPLLPALVATGTTPVFIAVTPSGNYAYVANQGGNSISQYSINPNGNLAEISTPVAAGTCPVEIAIDLSGRYAYAANSSSNEVSQYLIGENGTLRAMSPATIDRKSVV